MLLNSLRAITYEKVMHIVVGQFRGQPKYLYKVDLGEGTSYIVDKGQLGR